MTNIPFLQIKTDHIIAFSLFILLLLLLFWGVFRKKKKRSQDVSLTPGERDILNTSVDFYNKLNLQQQHEFELRIQYFLKSTRITGVNTEVEVIDRMFIAASAIIPIFKHTNWQYGNLHEVLLYPEAFGDQFTQEGYERYTAGLVGNGPYQNVMVISKHQLHAGYLHKDTKDNVGIHEFAHLVDKTDGDVDGLPASLLPTQFHAQWQQLVQDEIQKIKNGQSDINSYGATNAAEFFAVVSEYFFKQPHQMQLNHAELYELLEKIYNYGQAGEY